MLSFVEEFSLCTGVDNLSLSNRNFLQMTFKKSITNINRMYTHHIYHCAVNGYMRVTLHCLEVSAALPLTTSSYWLYINVSYKTNVPLLTASELMVTSVLHYATLTCQM